MMDKGTDKEKVYPATIAEVIDESRVAINRGAADGIKVGQKFMIYRLSDEPIKDPINDQLLGYLEVPKGTGKVIHVQEKLAIIESNEKEEDKEVTRYTDPLLFSTFDALTSKQEVINVSYRKIPFKNPQVGDRAKPI